jgi:hypothetical protein
LDGLRLNQQSARVDGLSVEQLEQLAEAVLDFSSQSDLTHWLDVNAQAE